MKEPSGSSTLPLHPETIARLDQAFEQALSRGTFPGASLLVAQGGRRFARTYGHTEKTGPPVTPSTRFDLASLTKPLVTTLLCLTAIARGLLGLDDTLTRFFPLELIPEDKRRITLRHLLSHSSGLPAHRPFYLELLKHPPDARRDTLLEMVLRTPAEAPPGTAAVYSDLGFMLIGAILERLFGARLDAVAQRVLFKPLGIGELHFCPIETGADPEIPPAVNRNLTYAATQICPWRKRLLAGEVDDENCWSLGGVAPHAGLFGTSEGVFSLLSFLASVYRGSMRDPLWPRELVRTFWSRARMPVPSTWALGFDTPNLLYSSAGKYFSRNSVGHLGFTGTSFWLDLDREILVILLTNRIHPTRHNDGIKRFRPLLHNMIMEALSL
ncbi:MAG: beta-lactamase family protein [Desulfobacteraceae bacterium]|nr:beta-lactamase family protein [Desulfobacteraceae bacterium]